MAGLEGFSEVERQHMETLLKARAGDLRKGLDDNNLDAVMTILAEMNESRNTMLFQEVGQLTRGLHEAIKEFNSDFDTSAEEGKTRVDSNANERLTHVLELTEEAANNTMDMVEKCMPVSEGLCELARMLRNDWKSLSEAGRKPAELRDLSRSTESFLMEIEKGADVLNKYLTDILVAQGFQDITGQLIKRVMELVQDVERKLVDLVAVAGRVDRIRGTDSAVVETETEAERKAADEKKLVKGHGPQIKSEGTSGVVSNQDDVDDLLSSLGF